MYFDDFPVENVGAAAFLTAFICYVLAITCCSIPAFLFLRRAAAWHQEQEMLELYVKHVFFLFLVSISARKSRFVGLLCVSVTYFHYIFDHLQSTSCQGPTSQQRRICAAFRTPAVGI
jgi:hypothetical protein